MLGESGVLSVHFAAGCVFDTERLDSGNNDNRLAVNGGTRKLKGFFDSYDLDRTAGQIQCAAVGMARIAERIRGLIENGVARYEPENHGALGAKQFGHGKTGGVTSQQRLAAAGGHTQTNVRHASSEAC